MTEHRRTCRTSTSSGDSWGLGWIRFGWDGRRLIGHDGNTLGQAAFLRVLPDEGLAVTLLTNGGNTRDLYEDLYREIFAELADVEMPQPLDAARASPSTVDVSAARRHVRARERSTGGARARRAAGPAHGRSPARSPRSCPRPSHEYPMVGGRRRTCSSSAIPTPRPGRR